MARAIITATAFVPNGNVADPAGTANVVANGQVLAAASVAPGYRALLLLRVSNATGSATTVTIAAGTQPSAISSGQGALVVSVAATTGVQWLGPFDSSRFQQADGSILIDSAAVVTVTAFTLDPRRV